MQPLVSVCVLVYNHGKYLKQCLDNILNQETTFPFEIIIHDDASLDNSTEIVREYATRHPKIIVPVIQTENQYSQHQCVHKLYRDFLYPRVHGKYIAYCEGDDYWSSKHKLQKEVEILNEYDECHMCVHYAEVVHENGEKTGEGYPQKTMVGGKKSSYEFMKDLADGRFFHTSSFMTRYEDIIDLINNIPDYYLISDVDDVPLLLYMGQKGDNYYLNESMSCYRRNSIGSWTERQKQDINRIIEHKWKMIEMYKSYDWFTSENIGS